MAKVNAHPSATISSEAVIGDDVEIGPNAVIEKGARIGDRCRIRTGAVVKSNTSVGADCVVKEYAVLGGDPQHQGWKGEPTYLRIGQGNYIGEYVSMHRAYTPEGATVVGDQNYFMAYSHVGHDCLIGNHCVVTNYAGLAGHVQLEDRAWLAAYAGIHQFVRIGALAMLGGGAKIGKDAVPYMTYLGMPARAISPNLLGMQRNGVPKEARQAVRKAYKILFRSSNSISEACRIIRSELPQWPEIKHILSFIEKSERGISL